MESSLELTIK